MTAEENKTIVRRYIEDVINTGEYDRLEEFIAPGYINHIVGPSGERVITGRGPEWYGQSHSGVRAAFPDLHIEIEDIIAEGDLVAIHMIWSGTHMGEFRGIAPTGKHVSWGNTAFRRVANGMIVEGWGTMAIWRQMLALGADLGQYER